MHDFRFPQKAICNFEHGLVQPCEFAFEPLDLESLEPEDCSDSTLTKSVLNLKKTNSIVLQNKEKDDKELEINSKEFEQISKMSSENNIQDLELLEESKKNSELGFQNISIDSESSIISMDEDSKSKDLGSEPSFEYIPDSNHSENQESLNLSNSDTIIKKNEKSEAVSNSSLDSFDNSIESKDFIQISKISKKKKSILLFSQQPNGGVFSIDSLGYTSHKEIKNPFAYNIIKEINEMNYRENKFLNLLKGECKLNQLVHLKNSKISGILSFVYQKILFIFILDADQNLKLAMKKTLEGKGPTINISCKDKQVGEVKISKAQNRKKLLCKRDSYLSQICFKLDSADDGACDDIDQNLEKYIMYSKDPKSGKEKKKKKEKSILVRMEDQIIISESEKSLNQENSGLSIQSIDEKSVDPKPRIGLLSTLFSEKLKKQIELDSSS